MVISDDYPELLAILAREGESAFSPLAGEKAGELGFELAEYVRVHLGGTSFRLLVWREDVKQGRLDVADLEHPSEEPEVRFTTSPGNNVDLIAFVHAAARWLIGQRLPDCDPSEAMAAASVLAQRFHFEADGRDQTYIQKGVFFEKNAKYRRIWDAFTGHNFTEIAKAEGLTETRIRQIINRQRLRRRGSPEKVGQT